MLAAGLTGTRCRGNVVVCCPATAETRRHLLTGSHYDTVINAGKYDGRLGILLPSRLQRHAACRIAPALPARNIAFAEEEGVRFKSTFLGSRAVVGKFEPDVLQSVDAQEYRCAPPSRRQAMTRRPSTRSPAIRHSYWASWRCTSSRAGLLDAGLPVGVVTSIAGSIRRLVTVQGLSGHAGTVPMALRHDAAAAAAEIVLAVERRCGSEPGLVGTVGKLEVPGGAVNVDPRRCELSIDIRSGRDAVRDAALADIDAEIERIARRAASPSNGAPCSKRRRTLRGGPAGRLERKHRAGYR